MPKPLHKYQEFLNYEYQKRHNRAWAKAATMIFIIVMIAVLGGNLDAEVQKTWQSINRGDKIYADSSHVANPKFNKLYTYRRIRPFNANDIKKRKIPSWKKLKLIAQLDTSAEHNQSLMIMSNLVFLQDKMFKRHTAQIGVVIKKDSTTAEKPKEGSHSSPSRWYAIIPNRKLYSTNFEMIIPPGYKLADKYYYVDPYEVSGEEFKVFRKK